MKDGINRKNLQKLATFLAYGELPKDVGFNMWSYCSTGTWGITRPPCGSVACAVGLTPFAGIRKLKAESFNEYCLRVFGVDADNVAPEFQWCFASGWSGIDNTPNGAAKRIQHLLDKGIPKKWRGYPNDNAKKLYARTKVKK